MTVDLGHKLGQYGGGWSEVVGSFDGAHSFGAGAWYSYVVRSFFHLARFYAIVLVRSAFVVTGNHGDTASLRVRFVNQTSGNSYLITFADWFGDDAPGRLYQCSMVHAAAGAVGVHPAPLFVLPAAPSTSYLNLFGKEFDQMTVEFLVTDVSGSAGFSPRLVLYAGGHKFSRYGRRTEGK